MSSACCEGAAIWPGLPDSKSINRLVFGAYYEEDIYDRACRALPGVMRALWWRIPQRMVERNLIFVHVPRAAGTSISRALYGEGCTHHFSARYYRAVNPKLWARAQSFAVLRDPFDRFASAYAFVRAGGTPSCRLSNVFARQTAHVVTVDDYLSFLEGRGPLDLDFVMRPQSWFVCDGDETLVQNLFLYGEDDAALASWLAPQGVGPLPWLNRSRRIDLLLNPVQRRRIAQLYRQDFALIESVRAKRAVQWKNDIQVAAIAAE
jgi:hypothetical protein